MTTESDTSQLSLEGSISQPPIADSSQHRAIEQRIKFWQETSDLLGNIADAPYWWVNKAIATNNQPLVDETLSALREDLKRTDNQAPGG